MSTAGVAPGDAADATGENIVLEVDGKKLAETVRENESRYGTGSGLTK